MTETLTIRRSNRTDFADIDKMLADSYPRLLAADYPPSMLVTALPIISRARPELVASGRYFVAEEGGRIVGAGGWSMGAAGIGDIRHVVTDYRHQRRGIGRCLMQVVLADARATGLVGLECLSSRTAQPFYESLGFRTIGPVSVPLRPGIAFPAIRMTLRFT
jgi:GNAT superfamily N-acetyltransferase